MRVRGARPCREGWRFYVVCVCVEARVLIHARERVRVQRLCVQLVQEKGQDMSAHWESGSFTWRDHFTLPPEALFPPKAFSCSWLSTCRECNWERKGRIISTYNLPQKYCSRKEKKKRERRQQCQGARERKRERGQERERGTLEKSFCSFPFFSLHRLHLFLSGNMDQGPKSPALRLGRAGRVGSAHLSFYLTLLAS